MVPSVSAQTRHDLDWLVSQLDACAGMLDEPTVRRLLTHAKISPAEISPYVEPRAESYARRCIARHANYELLVLTWHPSQGSVAHDHAGCLCGLKVVQGRLNEQIFELGSDGQVRKTTATHLKEGDITVDSGVVVHALGNDADSAELLVTVHIYSPPLPEIRRYAVAEKPPSKIFLRKRSPQARTIAIIGGGFTGTMALANLLRFGNQDSAPLHIVMIDRQPAIGEGIAYRTNDTQHLLNVPANKMSAWPDRPDDFLNYARSQDASIHPDDFLPRKIYGQYVRQALLNVAESASGHLSIELVRDEATQMTRAESSDWIIQTAGGHSIRAELAVLTLGHRPPSDPFINRWVGPRDRFIPNPWASLQINQISPDEPVLVLGSGLTAIDAILTLCRNDRKAPLWVVSRRGLMPLPHLSEPKPAADLSDLINHWLDAPKPPTIRQMLSALRQRIAASTQAETDWRQIIDALRPATHQLWHRLSTSERSRFLERLRPFWEIHRHRTPPAVSETIDRLRKDQKLHRCAGTLLSAFADADGVDVTLSCRGSSATRSARVSWVVNCTGPGAHSRHSTHPILRNLLEAGTLCDDELGLGLQTDSVGHAIVANGNVLNTLLIAGTLRKSTLWESTAVPELRLQAQTIAQTALATLLHQPRP